MEAIFPMVFMIGVFGLIVWFGLNQSKKRQQMYAQAAAQLGLESFAKGSFGHPTLSGTYRGFTVGVDIEVHGSGKHKTSYTRFKVAYPGRMPKGLNVVKEGLVSKIGKFFGGQDIQVGDPVLDNALLIKGQDPGQVVAFFNKRTAKGRVGDGILSLLNQGSQARLNESEGGVMLVLGYMKNVAQIQMNLDTMVEHMAWISGETAKEQSADLFFDPDAPKPPETPKLPPPNELPPVIPPAPEKQPEKVRWDITDLQSDKPKPKAQPAPAPKPTPAPSAAPEPAVPAGADPRLEKLAERSLGYRQRSELLEQLEGQTLQVQVIVEGSERTRGVGLADEFRDGLTLLGKVGSCAVGIRFPSAMSAQVQAMAPGSNVSVSVTVVDWDNFYRRASMERMG